MEEKERFTLECGRVRTNNNANFKHIEYEVDENGCWNCVSHKADSSGYPQLRLNKSKLKMASRVVYEFYKGEIKEGNFILHTCDNPKCINPEHLIEGTHQENMQDMFNKNRNIKPMKIDIWREEDILDVYDLFKSKLHTQKELCKIYNMSRGTVSRICSGRSFKHILFNL